MVTKNGNCLNSPCEVIEVRYPVRIEEYSVIPESTGPGAHRGGFGVRRIWRCLAPITISAHVNRTWFRPWGLKGGEPAGNAALLFKNGGGPTAGSRPRTSTTAYRRASSRTSSSTRAT